MLSDEAISLHRRAKRASVQRLRRIDMGRYQLAAVDMRLETYAREVISNPGAHNLYELLALEVFFRRVRRYGLHVGEVRKFVAFYERLKFPGLEGMRSYALTPVQVFQFANIYGFWEGDRRVVREAVLYVPRKFSKTTSTAAIALYDLLYGDANAECYTGANSADQAKKCFDVIRGCMMRLDPYEKRYKINEQTIKSRRADRQAFAQCLTANARTKDGLSASTVIMDEFSQARDMTLLKVLTTSMGVHNNPLTVIITTASDLFDAPFYAMLQGYQRLLLTRDADDRVFAHLFMPDPGDDETAPSTWRKVHPHIGVTISEQYYADEYAAALRGGAEAMLAFRTKFLNVYAENERQAWISAKAVRAAMRPFSLDLFGRRTVAMLGLDLSESGDLTALSTAVYIEAEDTYYVKTDYFFARGALPGHPCETLFRKWADEGHLRLTEGAVIDYRAVVERVLEIGDRVNIMGIGYDPYRSPEPVNMLAASGARTVLRAVSQSIGRFSAATEFFEHQFKTGHVVLDDNPITAYCFGNAVLVSDGNDNYKPDKRGTGKIDGVISALMAMTQFNEHEQKAEAE